MRPCGYYPKSSRRPQWSELSLPRSLTERFARDSTDPLFTLSIALSGVGGRIRRAAELRLSDLLAGGASWIEWPNAIAFLAAAGYEPVLPMLVPPEEPPRQTAAVVMLGTLENNPGLEPYYADYATRVLIGHTLENMAQSLWPMAQWDLITDEEARETLASLMPLICSLWPYADFAHANVANYDLLDWKSVGSVVRFQGW